MNADTTHEPDDAYLDGDVADQAISDTEQTSFVSTGLDLHRWAIVAFGLVALSSIVARFFVGSSLWLDEALSVNIASLPLGDIPEALRSDGHPPLYYWLLHSWMEIFGDGNISVRALSGVISVATLGLAALLGRRLGGTRTAATLCFVVVCSSFAFRYGSEARMYALVMAECFAGYLLIDAARRRWTYASGAGIAVVTSLLLWTHYWSMWLIAGVGLLLVWDMATAGRSEATRRTDFSDASMATALSSNALKILLAAGLGALTFLPWVDSLLYQNEHTGTPWAPSFRPATLVFTSLVEFAGGPFSETQLMMLFMVVIVAIGITGSARSDSIVLSYRIMSDARAPLVALVTIAAVSSVVGLVTGIAFAPRYASIYFPFFAVLVALGLNRFTGTTRRSVVFGLFTIFSLVGLGLTFTDERTQAPLAAAEIIDATNSGLVVTCPDQLGPATERALRDAGDFEIVTYPDFEDPKFVNWVDYAERNAAADPIRFAQDVIERADGRLIVMVWSDGYLTFEGQCPTVLNELAKSHTGTQVLKADVDGFYESMNVTIFRLKV